MALANLIQRSQPRVVDQRAEPRRTDLADRAVIFFRGQQHLVPVLDISSRGARIRSDIAPRIGEAIVIQFDACSPVHAFVRWIRDGRIGLNFGHEIVLGA